MMVFKSFSDTITENLNSFDDDYAPFINYSSSLFDLLCGILDDDRLSRKNRLEIGAAISYFVVPNDVIPEEIYGPYGYVDDIFISVYVLKRIADEYGYNFLQNIWGQKIPVKDVIETCYDDSLELLEDKVYSILYYAGLVD